MVHFGLLLCQSTPLHRVYVTVTVWLGHLHTTQSLIRRLSNSFTVISILPGSGWIKLFTPSIPYLILISNSKAGLHSNVRFPIILVAMRNTLVYFSVFKLKTNPPKNLPSGILSMEWVLTIISHVIFWLVILCNQAILPVFYILIYTYLLNPSTHCKNILHVNCTVVKISEKVVLRENKFLSMNFSYRHTIIECDYYYWHVLRWLAVATESVATVLLSVMPGSL